LNINTAAADADAAPGAALAKHRVRSSRTRICFPTRFPSLLFVAPRMHARLCVISPLFTACGSVFLGDF
jgi:hypothetical protein